MSLVPTLLHEVTFTLRVSPPWGVVHSVRLGNGISHVQGMGLSWENVPWPRVGTYPHWFHGGHCSHPISPCCLKHSAALPAPRPSFTAQQWMFLMAPTPQAVIPSYLGTWMVCRPAQTLAPPRLTASKPGDVLACCRPLTKANSQPDVSWGQRQHHAGTPRGESSPGKGQGWRAVVVSPPEQP